MRRIRKLHKKLICIVLLLLGLWSVRLIYDLVCGGHQQNADSIRKLQLKLIEESIQSIMNQGECKIPDLPIDNPEIMAFYKETEKIDCGNSLDDWVTCEKSICLVNPEVTATKGEVFCSYTDLVRETDYKSSWVKKNRTKKPYVLQKSDFVKVTCSANNGDRWNGMAFGIRNTVHRSVNRKGLPMYNVLMWGFNSMSRNAYIRKLPKTYEFLVNNLQAMVLQGYNIVGDGTMSAMIPLLTGHTELQLPKTRRFVKNSVSVDVYPMVWKEFEHAGYMTSINDGFKYGAFEYLMNGFEKQPTDHYMSTLYLKAESRKWGRYCIGNQPSHLVMLNYTTNFMAKYSMKPRFILSFHGELSYDEVNIIGSADDDMVDWLTNLRTKGLLDDTILIVMSDHGNRFSDARNTLQGKQEERLPFFSFAFPETFKNRHPKEFRNFQKNVKRLTTPFDIHETLIDILRIQSYEKRGKPTEQPTRGISLFNSIPQNRSCASAYIEPHWCACLNWRPINDTTSNLVHNIAYIVLATINSVTDNYRNWCELLELKHINWVLKLMPDNELMKFKQHKDPDGYVSYFADNTAIYEEYYQIQITVSPGGGIYEASVIYHLGNFQATPSQISRINKYGSQADCIYEINPQLRLYCYCK